MRVTIELRRPRRLTIAIGLVLVLLLAPAVVLASHQFSDVPNSHSFHGDIHAVAAAGVTSGCGGGKYCPDDFITRGQMAAFINRLGALAGNKTPVVNADRIDGLDSTGFLPSAFYQVHKTLTVPSSGAATATTNCDTGDRATAAGYYNVLAGTHIYGDYPSSNGIGWVHYLTNQTTGYSYIANFYVMCADFAPYH